MCKACGSLQKSGALKPLPRQTNCKRGHSLEDAYVDQRGYRICRECARLRGIEQNRRKHTPRPAPTISSDPAVLAYTAGIFDGEGSVTIRRNRKPGTDKVYHGLAVSVTSTDPRLPAWLQERFGGKINRHLHHTKPNNSPAEKWTLLARHAYAFLEALEPYLIVKRTQAGVALKLRDTVTRGGPSTPISDELFTYREGLRQEIMRLNKHRRLAAPAAADTADQK